MRSQMLDRALDAYLRSGSLQTLLPHRGDLDALAGHDEDALRRMAGAELSLWMLDTARAAAHLSSVIEVRNDEVIPKLPLPEADADTPDWLLGALFTTAGQLQYRYHAHYASGIRLCDIADRYLDADRRRSWFWRQKNQVTRCRLLYRKGEHQQAVRLLAETNQAVRAMYGQAKDASSDAIDVVFGIANEIRASIAATSGELETAQILIMESLSALSERDPVRHAYANLSASRIYASLGGENARMASRFARLAMDEFAEYGHAFEGRARNQYARSLVALGQLERAEDEVDRARAAIETIANEAERTFATAECHLTVARLAWTQAGSARTDEAQIERWKQIEEATRAALSLSPIPDRIRADAQIRHGQAVLKQRPRSAKALQSVEDGIELAARADRVRIVAVGRLVLAEHFHDRGDALQALAQLELARELAGAASSDTVERWANQLAGRIDQPVRVDVRGRTYREVMQDFQTRLKDYYIGISQGDEERFRRLSGLGRSEFFRASGRK